MEKPIRIIDNERIRTFNERVRNGLEHALNFMLGSEDSNKVQISSFEPFLMPIEVYIKVYKKKSVLIKIFSENDFKGELYWFFEFKSAILLGSLMRQIPMNALKEKVDIEKFDKMDEDSFGEVGNQLCGILDRAFRTLTKKNIHLRMDFDKKIFPDDKIDATKFPNTDEYIVLLCNITIPGYEPQKLTLLLPRNLYELMLGLEIQLADINPNRVLLYTWNEALGEELQKKINSRYSKLVMVKQPEDLFTITDQKNVVAVGMDLDTITYPIQMNESILIKRIASNRNLPNYPLFFSFGNPTANAILALKKLGMSSASMANLETDFIPWCAKYLKDPSVKS